MAARLDVQQTDIEQAAAVGNIPTLLMVLYHLTGEACWLADPYRPTRNRGLGDHRSGGLDSGRQAEVRAAFVAAMKAWLAGREPVIAHPDGETLHRMMEVCMGEPISVDYVPMIAAQMGFAANPRESDLGVSAARKKEFHTVIIGAGISGLLAGLELKKRDIPFTILERQPEVGGNWVNNRYPGCGVDTPSYLYSYSFYQRDWSTHFAKRDEVMRYIEGMAKDNDLYGHIQFGVDVKHAAFDSESQGWQLDIIVNGGESQRLHCNAVICATGLFHTPKMPNLPGLDQFKGPLFHSAEWPDGLDLSGRHVAVVGTGASAMQIVPAITDQVGRLSVFQRSPQWIAPSEDYFKPMRVGEHWLINEVPFYYYWYRFRLAWAWTDRIYVALKRDPDWPHPERSMNAINDGHRRVFTEYLMRELSGREDLQVKALPDYPPFGKRILLDNGWYAALRRDHVELISDSVAAVTKTGLVKGSGEAVDADIIVMCTGFEAQRFARTVNFYGLEGRSLYDAWEDDNPKAYLGITTPGFPNLFFMYGPNTNPIGGSYISLAECQVTYICSLIQQMLNEGLSSVDVDQEVNARYNELVDEIHADMVWTHPGMQTYYRNRKGRVVTNIPWRIIDYWNLTREADLADYRTTAAR